MKIAASTTKEKDLERRNNPRGLKLVPGTTDPRRGGSFRIELSDDLFRPRRIGEKSAISDSSKQTLASNPVLAPNDVSRSGIRDAHVTLAAVAGVVIGFLLGRYWR